MEPSAGKGGATVVDDRPRALGDRQASTGAVGPGGEGKASESGNQPGLGHWVRNTGWTLLGLQLVAMVVFSTVQYDRFGLTFDFANYAQAWWLIAHGHLDPYIAGFGVPFWKNDAEFAMYPLALLDHVYPHPVVLLWVQDVAAVLTEVVAFGWVRRAIGAAGDRLPKGTGPLLAVGAAVVLVLDPWVYETVAFDFHFEAIAGLFTLLVAFDLWSGRSRRMWLWVALCLLSSGLSGLFLVGVGISGILAGRPTRRSGILIGAAGAGWFILLSALGGIGVGGKTFGVSYGYLTGGQRGAVGPLDIVGGALMHPGAAAHMAAGHWAVIVSFLVVVGLVGLASPWGIGMAVVVLVPNLLNGSGSFVSYGASFQSWPALPFILIGSVMVVIRLLQKGEAARRVARITLALWASAVISFAALALPGLARVWLWTSPSAATELASIESVIPADAEVVVSEPVMGRFAQRESVVGFIEDDQSIPVNRKVVVFVLSPYESFQKQLSRAGISEAGDYLGQSLHARLLGAASGVSAYSWSPRPGTRRITLP